MIPEIIRFGAVTLIVLIGFVIWHVITDLIGPNGADDIRATRLRQDQNRALQSQEPTP